MALTVSVIRHQPHCLCRTVCEQPLLLLCRLSLAQFVTYNPELQVFTASLLRFTFQETGSIRVSLARCLSSRGLDLIAIVCQGISGATCMRQHGAWPLCRGSHTLHSCFAASKLVVV